MIIFLQPGAPTCIYALNVHKVTGYLLLFSFARCVRVRQKLVPRNLSATHNLAPDVPLRSIRATQGRRSSFSTRDNRGVSKTRNSFSLMKEHTLKKGRPEKTKGKRIRKIDTRFTEEEFKAVLGLEKTLGVRRTDLVRTRLLQNAQLTIINAKELIGLLDEIGTELGRCGNNINQLAKYANILNKYGRLSPVVVERFNLLFEVYIGNQKALEAALRKIIRALG